MILHNDREEILRSTASFSIFGEGSDVPYSGDISLTGTGASLGPGGEEGVSKLVEDFE